MRQNSVEVKSQDQLGDYYFHIPPTHSLSFSLFLSVALFLASNPPIVCFYPGSFTPGVKVRYVQLFNVAGCTFAHARAHHQSRSVTRDCQQTMFVMLETFNLIRIISTFSRKYIGPTYPPFVSMSDSGSCREAEFDSLGCRTLKLPSKHKISKCISSPKTTISSNILDFKFFFEFLKYFSC